ncbi:MAG: ParB/RepB/Spo0J family partition protein [Pseudomonadota bacterium]
MSRKPARKGLGRGLSQLLGDVEGPAAVTDDKVPSPEGDVATLPIDLVHPNPDQPRKSFSTAELDELASSISERGIVQPLVVRRHPEKSEVYQIVAGERRWRAAQRAGLHDVPVTIRDLDDQAVMEIAIVENVQREDLNPLEEAEGYAQLIERYGHTQEAVARIIGKSRSHLANTLRLNGLPNGTKAHVREGRLSAGHARALLTAFDPDGLADRVVAQGLSVRQTEKLAKRSVDDQNADVSAGQKKGAGSSLRDTDTRLLEGDLSAAIGMRATLLSKPDGAGELRIHYKSYEELERLCEKLTQ